MIPDSITSVLIVLAIAAVIAWVLGLVFETRYHQKGK
jgi:Ca2+/H+ antiporter